MPTINFIDPFTNIPYVELPVADNNQNAGGTFLSNLKELNIGDGGNNVFRADKQGIWLGGKTFASAPFSVSMSGAIVASSFTLTGGQIKYGKTSFTDSAHAGYYLGSEGVYMGAASDANFLKYAISTGSYAVKAAITTTAGSVLDGQYLGPASVTADKINTISATQITGSITASQIGSVNASAIAGSITSGQITSITAGQITGSISGTQIANLAITADKIANLTITSGKIQDLAITNAKIGDLSADKITAGTLTGRIVQTATSGARVVMKSELFAGVTDAAITFYGSSGIVGGLSAQDGDGVNIFTIGGSGGNIVIDLGLAGSALFRRISAGGVYSNAVSISASGAAEFGGDLTVNGDLIPKLNNTYDLGSSSYKWRNLNLAGNIILPVNTEDITGDLVPVIDNNYELGLSATQRWYKIWAHYTGFGDIGFENDFRMTEEEDYGLSIYNQHDKKIMVLDDKGNLWLAGKLHEDVDMKKMFPFYKKIETKAECGRSKR